MLLRLFIFLAFLSAIFACQQSADILEGCQVTPLEGASREAVEPAMLYNNINFYDDVALNRSIVPFVISSLRTQHKAGLLADRCIILGTGKLKTFSEREVRHAMGYKNIVYLEHPRFIMQYRRKHIQMYVDKYVDAIRVLMNPF